MRIIEPRQFSQVKRSRRKVGRPIFAVVIILLLFVAAAAIWSYRRPIRPIQAKAVTVGLESQPVSLAWPKYGQAAVNIVGYSAQAATLKQKTVPIASVAKIITALAVLQTKPLAGPYDQGPTITLEDTDVSYYTDAVNVGGSVVGVEAGEQITERQALEAMLLPSANNIADSLATWAFGSIESYASYATKMVKTLGMSDTHITSASGFDPATTSTAIDLVKLGDAALHNSAIASVVAEKSANIPVEGSVDNVNFLLGQDGIMGIKTGNTDQAGGCYLFAAKRILPNNQTATVIGAILGGPDLATAINDSRPLLNSINKNFGYRRLVSQGQIVGYYDLPWGGQVTANASKNIVAFGWLGETLEAKVQLENLASHSHAGDQIGSINSIYGQSPIVVGSNISQPSLKWRLLGRR